MGVTYYTVAVLFLKLSQQKNYKYGHAERNHSAKFNLYMPYLH